MEVATVTEIPVNLPFEGGQNHEFLLLPNTDYTIQVSKLTSAAFYNRLSGDSWYVAMFLMTPETYDHVPFDSSYNSSAIWSVQKVATGEPETLKFKTPNFKTKLVVCVSSNLCADSATSGQIRISGGIAEPVKSVPATPDWDADGYRILCLDGGGTRGLIEVKLLQAIERKTRKKIWELFNLICGTSTGGIIALLIGIKRYPLKVVEELYLDLAFLIFADIYAIGKVGLLSSGWRSSRLKSLSKAFFGPNVPLIATKCDNLKVFTLATLANLSPLDAFLFRNYESEDHLDGQACHAAIYEAALATSAAPTYFAPYTRNGNVRQTFIDGGLIANNPSEYAMIEAKRLWPDKKLSFLLSLGTGVPSVVLEATPGLLSTVDFTINTYTSSHNIHKRVLERMREYGMINLYARLSPDRGEGNYPLDLSNKDKLSQLANATEVYLAECERHQTRDFLVLREHFNFDASPKAGHARHLIVLLHGLFGSAGQLLNLQRYFQRRLEDSIVYVPSSNTSALKSVLTTLDGVTTGGDRILEEIRNVILVNPGLTHFSILGNSLGGLYARYCIGKLLAADWFKLEFFTFATICTPHLGVQNLLHPLKELLFSATSTGDDLTGGSVFLDELSKGAYLCALQKFRNRVLVGNLLYDQLVPFPTAMIESYKPVSLTCKDNCVEVLFRPEKSTEYKGTLIDAREIAPLSKAQRAWLKKLRELSWNEIHCYFKQDGRAVTNKHNTPAIIRKQDESGIIAVERLVIFFELASELEN